MIFVYTNYSEYISDKKKKAFKELDRIEEKIIQDQYLSINDRLSTLLYRKRLPNSYRLLILEYKKDDNIVYIFYRLLPHKEYDELREKIKDKKNIEDILGDDLVQIEKWYKEITQPKPKDDLPVSLIELLNFNIDKEFLKEDFIYESKEWIDYVKKNIVSLKNLHNELIDFFDNQKNTESFYIAALQKNKYFLTTQNTQISEKNFQRYSYRSYPKYLLADENLWFKIEQEDKSNLALSPEQIGIMENLQLPLFINGSAGSGKSTMLYYLFAEYIYKYRKIYKSDTDYPGLFITYSDRLLNTSKQEIEKILENNAKFIDDKIVLKDIIGKVIDFKTFKEFLIEITDEKDNFTDKNYLNFSKFKAIFEHSYKKKDITPELAWHIIRTYIRGYEIDEMKVERYREIPEKSKTVLQNEFEKVYNKIWNTKWCKELFEQNWDEIKIIRELAYSKINKKYSFIFSDEAQDYTKMEIEFLLSLLPYEDFEIPKESIQLPVIFAGDPLQTLNPTGFRWERIKDIYNDKISKILDKKISLGIKTLTYNYRNSKIINNFANRIQFIRKNYLKINEIETPQEVWFADTDNADFIGFVDNYIPKKEDDLKYIFIVGNKANSDKLPIEVFTTKDIKGEEFESVVIMNFFEQTLTEQWHKAAFEKMFALKELDTNEQIFLEYLFNNLYVAITRAKENLYIVEQNQQFHKYWDKLNEIEVNDEKWGTFIAKWNKITAATMKAANPKQQADTLFEAGNFDKDSKKLHLAAKIYRSIKQTHKADEAKALAFEYEAENSLESKTELYKKSADLYQKIGNEQKAFDNYWKAGSLDDILKFKNLTSTIEYQIASIIKNKGIEEIKNIDTLEVKKAWLSSSAFKEKFYKLIESKIKYIKDAEIIITLNNIVLGDKVKRLLIEQALNLGDSVIAKSILDELDSYDKTIEAKVMVAFYAAVPEKTLKYLYVLNEYDKIFELYDLGKYDVENLDLVAYSAIKSNNFDYLIKILDIIDNKRKIKIISRFLEEKDISDEENYTITKYIFDLPKTEFLSFCKETSNLSKLVIFKSIKEEQYEKLYDFAISIKEIPNYKVLEDFIEFSISSICNNNKINKFDKILFHANPIIFFKKLYLKDCLKQLKYLDTSNNLIEKLSLLEEKNAEILAENIDIIFDIFVDRLKLLERFIKQYRNNNIFKERWLDTKKQYIEYLKNNNEEEKAKKGGEELRDKQNKWNILNLDNKNLGNDVDKLREQLEQERQKKEDARQRLLDSAKLMKSAGLSIEQIIQATGLSNEDIKKL